MRREVWMGERTGFTEYVVARRPLMFRTAWVLCRDPHQAEDLVQHVLTRLYVVWPRVSGMDAVDGYVRRMLVNANLDRLRRRREHTGLEGWDRAAETPDTEAVLDLREALARLAPGQRRALVLRHLWGLSVEETAATLGIAPGTVKSQTADAMTRLRALLAPHPDEGQAP
jgi:RNA polymerase sigma-70 factor (sigma-E family)